MPEDLNITLFLLLIPAAVYIIYLLYKLREIKQELENFKTTKCTNKRRCQCCNTTKVLFFPDSRQVCYSYIQGLTGKGFNCRSEKECTEYNRVHFNRLTDSPDYSILQLYNALSKAKKSIDVCMYHFTHHGLARLLINKHNAKCVEVKIITDLRKKSEDRSQIPHLSSSGIEIKSKALDGDCNMHNKFVIIDNKLVISGSLNWTHSIDRSFENIIFTGQDVLVKKFAKEFKDLWSNTIDINSTVVKISS